MQLHLDEIATKVAPERTPLSSLIRLAGSTDARRSNGFNRFYDWLEGRDFLFIRADRIVVVKLELAAEIAAMAEHAKGSAP